MVLADTLGEVVRDARRRVDLRRGARRQGVSFGSSVGVGRCSLHASVARSRALRPRLAHARRPGRGASTCEPASDSSPGARRCQDSGPLRALRLVLATTRALRRPGLRIHSRRRANHPGGHPSSSDPRAVRHWHRRSSPVLHLLRRILERRMSLCGRRRRAPRRRSDGGAKATWGGWATGRAPGASGCASRQRLSASCARLARAGERQRPECGGTTRAGTSPRASSDEAHTRPGDELSACGASDWRWARHFAPGPAGSAAKGLRSALDPSRCLLSVDFRWPPACQLLLLLLATARTACVTSANSPRSFHLRRVVVNCIARPRPVRNLATAHLLPTPQVPSRTLPFVLTAGGRLARPSARGVSAGRGWCLLSWHSCARPCLLSRSAVTPGGRIAAEERVHAAHPRPRKDEPARNGQEVDAPHVPVFVSLR